MYLPSGTLFQRVIGDEAQCLRYRESMTHRAFRLIPCVNRGMATATPTINKIRDITGLGALVWDKAAIPFARPEGLS